MPAAQRKRSGKARRPQPIAPEREYHREQLTRTIADAIKRAPTSLVAHALAIHRDHLGRPAALPAHALEWARILEDRERYPNVVIVSPPGYLKSSVVSMIYPTWRIGATNGNIRIGLISNNWNLAAAFSKEVQDHIRSPFFQAAYPDVKPHYHRGWRLDRWFTTGTPPGKDPTVAAAGMGGRIQGARLDEIILDDPTTFEDARSPQVMESQRMFLKNTLVQRFPVGMRPPHGKGGRMVVVLTRWSERDLVPVLVEELGFKLVHMPALGYWDRSYECPNCGAVAPPDKPICRCDVPPVVRWGGAPLWPEAEPLEQLLAEQRDDELIFELVKQGNPRALSGDVFDAAHFQRGQAPSEFEMVVQWVDTAGGKDRRRGDFFALVTLGRRGRDTWVLDVERGRWPAPDQERAVLREGAEWDPDLVCIAAANEGTALYQRLVASGSRLPLQLREETKDKEFRAIPLANGYRAHLVWHADRDTYGNPNKWVHAFESELEAFPGGAHDDMCFPADTLVLRPDGPCAIEAVRADDVVLGQSGWVRVLRAGCTGTKEVHCRWGMRATAEHPVWTERGWTPFLDVSPDDVLKVRGTRFWRLSLRPARSHACAAGRQPTGPESEPVFNLTTTDGTYFADGILVHNCDAAAGAFAELDRTSPRVRVLGPNM